jgi:hypothetical protein
MNLRAEFRSREKRLASFPKFDGKKTSQAKSKRLGLPLVVIGGMLMLAWIGFLAWLLTYLL